MLYGQKIGITKPFLYQLVTAVASIMRNAYPEFDGRVAQISKQIRIEEEKFMKTLLSGEEMLRQFVKDKKDLAGKDAFKLYDTYGFPIDLTIEICAEYGIHVDQKGFEKGMEKQKERARKSRREMQSMKKQSRDLLSCSLPSEFTYDDKEFKSKAIALFVDGKEVDSFSDEGDIIFAKTPFYAESGGQVADSGAISNRIVKADVIDVQKSPNKQPLHHVRVVKGVIKTGDSFILRVNHQQRQYTARNHTATHLLQRALEEVLGDHIAQQGSYVSSQYLRFDFNHFEKISDADLAKIEQLVNRYIAEAHQVTTSILPIAEAEKLGAKALFQEKYGDVVRVVIVEDVSKEFCGGTHVKNTSEIGIFKIESEESIASGIRRIQARTSYGAFELIEKKESVLNKLKQTLGASSYLEINDRLSSIEKDNDELKKRNGELLEKTAYALSLSLKNEFAIFNGFSLLITHLPDAHREGLLKICDLLKANLKDYVIILTGGNSGAIPIIACVGGRALKEGIKAGNLVKIIAKDLNGSGGGRDAIAFGQGKDAAKIKSSLSHIKEFLN